jgi:predicted GNAT superfamily acetyltransferase
MSRRGRDVSDPSELAPVEREGALQEPGVAPSGTIRQATRGDFPDVLRLNEDWVRFTSPLDESALVRLHGEAAYHKVVESDGRVVAFLLALREGAAYDSPNYRWFSERGGTFLYVDRVVVDRDAQSAGLATMLYEDLFSFAREQGVPQVLCELDVEPPNEASRHFHDSRGFREVGRQWVAGGAKRVSMRRADVG